MVRRESPRVYAMRMSDPSLLTPFDAIRGRTLRPIDVPRADAVWTAVGMGQVDPLARGESWPRREGSGEGVRAGRRLTLG
jgi:hypothetical protein